MGDTLLNVTVSLASLARLRPASIRHLAVSTSAIESPPVPCASTAMCFASLAKGTPRARPDRVPSALSVIRSFGPTGATVIAPSGEAIFDCVSSQPASMVSASGTAIAKRPAELSQRLPKRRFPAALLVVVDGLGVGQIRENAFCGLGDNVLTLRHSVPRFELAHISSGQFARARMPSFLAPDDGEKPWP